MSDLPEHLEKPILIFGCGNVLFGDDGFGPAVTDALMANYDIPDNEDDYIHLGQDRRK